ncbi:MAG: TRAP transporter large permease [Oscillospiraceae bacterium]|nr:TRAP transporter large permease [Oscillospiraceae bacterium]MBQ4453617.1 TRAP transporter large permease [Clostridia bacterium]
MWFWICLGTFIVLLLLGVPIIISLGVPCGLWFVFSGTTPMMMFSQKMFTQMDSFSMLAIPLFMLAGEIMEKTNITRSLVEFANSLVGWIRGGLAQSTELAGMLLAGISGSSNADTSALGVLLYRPLRESGYDEGFANAIIISSGSIGPIIPPSICMIVYANAAGLNIGKLFMGGVLPGILMGVGYMFVCYFYAKKHNVPKVPFLGFKNIGKSFVKAIWALLMPIIIIGGVLSGVVTVTESGVLAVVYGIGYGFITRKLSVKQLIECVRNAARSTVAPVSLICVSAAFSYLLAREGIITSIANFVGANISSQVGFMLFIMLICVLSGCFVEGTAVMLLLTPILLPIALKMGIDSTHFSIAFILSLTTGGMSPPVGGQLFVMSSISKTPITKIAKPILFFLAVYITVIIAVIFIPGLATWIPNLFYGR